MKIMQYRETPSSRSARSTASWISLMTRPLLTARLRYEMRYRATGSGKLYQDVTFPAIHVLPYDTALR